jgi:glycosyltransferase involved in cell wall biosynthesis
VAAVAGHKGHDVLVDALAALADLPWRLVCAGALDRDPAFVADVQARAVAAGIADRIIYAGPLSGAALERAYADADVLVHPTRGEMYGLVVTEALAHGLPVIASDVGGVPEAFGARSGDPAPGQLVPPGESGALGDALRAWLTSPERRAALRAGALRRRAALPTWSATADAVRAALTTLTP